MYKNGNLMIKIVGSCFIMAVVVIFILCYSTAPGEIRTFNAVLAPLIMLVAGAVIRYQRKIKEKCDGGKDGK